MHLSFLPCFRLRSGLNASLPTTSGAYSFAVNADTVNALTANTTEDFTLQVSDGNGGTTSQTLTFNITGVNDAPALTGTPATLAAGTEDTAYMITATNLLKGFTDAENNPLSVSGLTATNGSLVNNNNGTFTFTPTRNFNGTVNLSYNVVDDNSGSTAATQSFLVAPVKDDFDFNGDGKDDIILSNAAQGWSSIWTMNGSTPVGWTALPNTYGARPV